MEKIERLNWALAKVIKDAREAKGLTQSQLAGFTGLSEIYLSQLECGVRGDSLNALLQMARVLEIPASELMRRIEDALENDPPAPPRKQGRPTKGRAVDESLFLFAQRAKVKNQKKGPASFEANPCFGVSRVVVLYFQAFHHPAQFLGHVQSTN
jgi:transcriptional regulator with XRE-family HTH domain